MAVVEVRAGMGLRCPHGRVYSVDRERMIVVGDHACPGSVYAWQQVPSVTITLHFPDGTQTWRL